MVAYSLRILKRLAVLVPGLLIVYVSIREIFPYFDRRLPLGFALLVTYGICAYVLLPAFVRLVRIIRPVDHLPLYCVTPDGFASDPLNIGIVTTRRQLIMAMEEAGWYMADQHSFSNVAHAVLSTLIGWSYPSAPVSSLYLFGRKQDLAFEIPIEGRFGSRHHVRFWATTYQDGKRLSVRSIHWHNRRAHISDDRLLWVGAASLDVGVTFIRHNLQISHMIHPDTDREREMIIEQLKAAKLINRQATLRLQKPARLANRVWRGYLRTDGKMVVAFLKDLRPQIKPPKQSGAQPR